MVNSVDYLKRFVPDHSKGFTKKRMKELLTEWEYEEFIKWMDGQTIMIDPSTEDWVFFTHDVQGWLGGRVLPFG